MTTSDINKIEEQCREFSALLSETEKAVFQWVSRQTSWEKEFRKTVEPWKKNIEKMPDSWYGLYMAQFAFGNLFGYPDTLRKFRKQTQDTLTEGQQQFTAFFIEKPWAYSWFGIKEKLKTNLFIIYDFSKDEEKILYSPGTEKNLKTGSKLFFTLLYDNGLCFQAAGPIGAFKGAVPDDFEYLAMELNPGLYQRQGPGAVVLRQPIPFMGLSFFSHVPAMSFRGKIMRHHFTISDAPALLPEDLPEHLLFDTVKQVIRFYKKEPEGEPVFDQPVLYIDKKKNLCLMQGITKESYAEGVEIFKDLITLDKEPDWICSPIVIESLKDILKKPDSFTYYQQLFTSPEETVESDAELERVNKMYTEYFDAYNHGLPLPTAEALSEKYDLPLDNVETLLDSIRETTEKHLLHIPGGIEELPPLSPQLKRSFQHTLKDNPLFDLVDNKKAADLYKKTETDRLYLHSIEGAPEIDFKHAADLLEWLHEDTLEMSEHFALLFFLYLLHKAGDTFRPVKEYIIEFMKAYWQIYYDRKEDIDWNMMETFLSVYLGHVLLSVGLVDTEPETLHPTLLKEGSYAMKASAFFKAWLRWKQP